MKKFAFGFACVLAGCAAGAAMPHVTAQTFAPNPSAQRWQQKCEMPQDLSSAPRNWDQRTQACSDFVASRGAEGWELVSQEGFMFCFKRPAP